MKRNLNAHIGIGFIFCGFLGFTSQHKKRKEQHQLIRIYTAEEATWLFYNAAPLRRSMDGAWILEVVLRAAESITADTVLPYNRIRLHQASNQEHGTEIEKRNRKKYHQMLLFKRFYFLKLEVWRGSKHHIWISPCCCCFFINIHQ